jgi:hypothetical protein
VPVEARDTLGMDDQQACWLTLGALLLWMAKRDPTDPARVDPPGWALRQR